MFLLIFQIIFIYFNMASKTAYPTSQTISCPSCSKPMLLKNWKDHCRQMHNLLPSIIDEKYNEMKRDIEQSRKSTASNTTMVMEKPVSATNTLFSMKKFALTRSINSNVEVVDSEVQVDRLQSTELNMQMTSRDSRTHSFDSLSTSTCVLPNINVDGMISWSILENCFISSLRQSYAAL